MSTDMILLSEKASTDDYNADAGAVAGDCFEDGCSICLEPFNSHDPATVTNCKHEYHLQCILEWSQRSTECPICCQLLELKDSTSQELLAAAKIERSLRTRTNIRVVPEDREVNHEASYANESDLEEQVLQYFATATRRARHVNRSRSRSRRQASLGQDSSEAFPFHSIENGINLGYGLEAGLATAGAPDSIIEPEPSVLPSVVNVTSDTAETSGGHVNHRYLFGHPSPDGPQRSSSSEFLAFSESVKAKLSSASARYKESITKSTRSFKEKLLARNTTVKELGREVQREMSAGIAGVARMIERFDLSSRRTGVSVPLSSASVQTPNFPHEEKTVEESVATQHPITVAREITHDMCSDVRTFNPPTRPAHVDVSLI